MKNKFKHLVNYVLLTSLFLLNIISCTNLDEHVYSSITEDSYIYKPGDASKLVGAVYANLRGMGDQNITFNQSITTDEAVQPANASGWDDGGNFRRMHLHSWTSEQNQVRGIWRMHFTGVLLANRVIQQLNRPDIPLSISENKLHLLAEMRVLRAFYYWNLIDNYGDIPFVTEPQSNLPAKSDRKIVYQFIVDELLAAIPALTEDKSSKTYGRVNQWVARTILANVYLNAEVYTGLPQYNECLIQCNSIISSNKYQLDQNYKDPFKTRNETSLENIFTVPFDEIYATGFNMYLATLHASNQRTYKLKGSPWGAGAYKAVPQFINTYDPQDSRLADTWLSGPQYEADGITPCLEAFDSKTEPLVFVNSMPDGIFTGEADGYRWKKYEYAIGANNNLSNDWVIFRLAQVHMMKAECLLRTGKADEAATEVTFVRNRAFKANPSKANVTGLQLSEASLFIYGTVSKYILKPQGKSFPKQFGRFYDELGWEFAGESFRRRDMIRFGHYTEAEWMSHVPNGSYRTVFPIPQTVIDANPKLEQNPNYIH